jgi:hypothetical protein
MNKAENIHNSVIAQGTNVNIYSNVPLKQADESKNIEDMLINLRNTIKNDSTVRERDKETSIQHISELLDIHKNPSINNKEKAKDIIRWFKGFVVELPKTIDIFNKLTDIIPKIEKIFS